MILPHDAWFPMFSDLPSLNRANRKTIGSDYEDSVYEGLLFISVRIRYIQPRP